MAMSTTRTRSATKRNAEPEKPADIIKQGKLRKKGKGMMAGISWKERYFILKSDGTFEYFEDDKYTKLKGNIIVDKIYKVERKDDNNLLLRTIKRTWNLQSDNKYDLDDWQRLLLQLTKTDDHNITDTDDGEYIPCIFNSMISNGFKYSTTSRNQHVAELSTVAMCELYMDGTTNFGQINRWKIRFLKIDNYEFISIGFGDYESNDEIMKTLPDNLSSPFNIFVTFDRSNADKSGSCGWDKLIIYIPAIDEEIWTQQKQEEKEDLVLRMQIKATKKCKIKAWKSNIINMFNISVQRRYTVISTNNYRKKEYTLNCLVYGYLREQALNYNLMIISKDSNNDNWIIHLLIKQIGDIMAN